MVETEISWEPICLKWRLVSIEILRLVGILSPRQSPRISFSFGKISAPFYRKFSYFKIKSSRTILISLVFRQTGTQEITVAELVGHFFESVYTNNILQAQGRNYCKTFAIFGRKNFLSFFSSDMLSSVVV